MERDRSYRVREFAALTGLTVRALHHYERLALLKPCRTSSGYRMYGVRDLERLEQIVALKFLGIPLKQIKQLLDRDSRKLPAVLEAQRLALEEKRRGLDRAINAIADAERSFRPGQQTEAAVLKKIIEVIEMQNDAEFFKKYYNDAAWSKLAAKREQWTPELQAQATADWTALFQEVEAAIDAGDDPAGEKVQALAARWKKLVAGFTGGDKDVSAGLNKVWADRANWPAATKDQTAAFGSPRMWEFMGRAMGSRTT